MGSMPEHEPPSRENDPARERILRSANRLFLGAGFEGTSVSAIAQASGVTPAALYWHFPGKVDILFAVLEALLRDGIDDLRGAVRGDDATTRLTEYVAAFVAQQMDEAENRNFGYSTLTSSLPPARQTEMWKLGRPYIDLLRDILEQGRETGEFDFADVGVTAFAINTMCEYVFTWWRATGRLSQDVVVKQYTDLALRMVTPPSRP